MATYTRTTSVDASPSGDTVKQAVVDVDTDLTGIVTAYNTHDTATTGVHGLGSGTVCGTTNTQSLTNKTLNGLTHTAATTGFTIAGGTASKTLTVIGDVSVGQAWTSPAFSAGNFTGSASMTWTVAAGDVGTFAYIESGKEMTVAFAIQTSTVGGTPATYLQITIPNSKTASKVIYNSCRVIDNGTASIGMCRANGTLIQIFKADAANWSAATDATEVFGEITFEIN